MSTGLEGVRVLDSSTQIAGPCGSKLLTDCGAEVIRVEPAGGDPMRGDSASGHDLAGRDGAVSDFLNAGKRSVLGCASDERVQRLKPFRRTWQRCAPVDHGRIAEFEASDGAVHGCATPLEPDPSGGARCPALWRSCRGPVADSCECARAFSFTFFAFEFNCRGLRLLPCCRGRSGLCHFTAVRVGRGRLDCTDRRTTPL